MSERSFSDDDGSTFYDDDGADEVCRSNKIYRKSRYLFLSLSLSHTVSAPSLFSNGLSCLVIPFLVSHVSFFVFMSLWKQTVYYVPETVTAVVRITSYHYLHFGVNPSLLSFVIFAYFARTCNHRWYTTVYRR